MKIINLDYLENTPLSTQLSKLTGDGWHAGLWTNEDGSDTDTMPSKIIKNVRTGQLFKMPKKKSTVIDYFYKSWEFKMELLEKKEMIQVSIDTHENLLCAVPPYRGGWSAFLVGEAMTHVNGFAVYCCCFEIDDKYFLTFLNAKDFGNKEHVKRYEQHLINYDVF